MTTNLTVLLPLPRTLVGIGEIGPKIKNYRERLVAVPKTGEKYDVETTNSSDEISVALVNIHVTRNVTICRLSPQSLLSERRQRRRGSAQGLPLLGRRHVVRRRPVLQGLHDATPLSRHPGGDSLFWENLTRLRLFFAYYSVSLVLSTFLHCTITITIIFIDPK